MTRTLSIIVSVLCLITGAVGGYAVGHHYGYSHGTDYGSGVQRGTAVLGFATLEKIRGGDTEGAIASLEPLVFRSLIELDESPRWRDWVGFDAILPSVAAYHDVYLRAQSEPGVYTELNALLDRRASR